MKMGSLKASSLQKRFLIALVLMSVIPLLYLGYLFNQHVDVGPAEGMWIFVAVCFLILCAGTGAFLVRSVFKSVVQIAAQAKALAKGESSRIAITVDDGGEIGELAKTINGIMERIRTQMDTLQSPQQELETTKARLRESYAKLQDAVVRLEKVDQMKSDFVANVAHELIHPLATLRGSLDIVLANLAKEDPQKKEILDISRRNMARLIRLVTDILDISRIESGKAELHIEPIEAREMMHEILVPLATLFAEKDIALEKNVALSCPTFDADRDRIIQAVTNLLINAVKYTPMHGKVRLEISNQDGQMKFAVADNGPGMSPADQAKLFDKFSRVTKEKQEGSGLGLCITKDIVTLHRGKIWVDSREGEGSRFTFVIPMRQEGGEVGHGR